MLRVEPRGVVQADEREREREGGELLEEEGEEEAGQTISGQITRDGKYETMHLVVFYCELAFQAPPHGVQHIL